MASKFGGIAVEEEEETVSKFGGVPVVQEQGIVGRSIDKLQLGLSDAISTVMGDSYGRSGDPLERDDLPVFDLLGSNRVYTALGGNIFPSVGEVSGDALIAAGKSVLPKAAQDAIASGMQSVMTSEPAQMAGRGLEKAKEHLGPEGTALAGELLNIGAAFVPVPKVKPKFAARNKRVLEKTLAKQKRDDLKKRFEPTNPYDQGTLKIKDDVLETKEFIPNKRYDAILDEVEKTPGVKSTNAHTDNREALELEVSKVRESLDKKLVDANPVSGKDLDDDLLEAMVRAEDHFMLQGDAGESAQRLYEEFNKMYVSKLDEAGNISARDLLDTRRDFDQMIGDAVAGDPFSPGGTAQKVAIRELRQSINKLIDKAAPDANVSEDLARMNKMLEARDVILPSTRTEAGTNIGRGMERLQERIGVKAPVSPLAIGQTVTSPKTVGLGAAAAALAMGGGRAISNTLKTGSVAGDRIMAELIRKGVPAAERAAILASLQEQEQ